MRKIYLIACAFLLAMSAIAPAAAQSSLFPGDWKNVNPQTRGLVRIVIQNQPPTQIGVHAYGACHPTPCDWGPADGYLYGPNVNANPQQTAHVATATYTTNFSVTILVIRPTGTPTARRLSVQSFTRFTDNSGRPPYTETDTFKK